jgi:hypothetical protein
MEDALMESILQSWKSYVYTPLDDTKYSKPVNRILERAGGGVCCLFHAIAYGDVEAIVMHPNKAFDLLNLQDKLKDETFDASSRHATMQYIHKLSELVLDIYSIPIPLVPSRDDIAQEIRAHKQLSKQQLVAQPQTGGLCQAISTLVQMAEQSELDSIKASDVATARELLTRSEQELLADWKATMQSLVGDRTVESLIVAADFDRLDSHHMHGVCKVIRLHELLADPKYGGEVQTLIKHINLLVQIQSNVSSEMRNTIESTAQRIASEIMDGKMSFDSLDVNAIGEEVLSQCQPEDLKSLAENLGTLLPLIQQSAMSGMTMQ